MGSCNAQQHQGSIIKNDYIIMEYALVSILMFITSRFLFASINVKLAHYQQEVVEEWSSDGKKGK